MDDDERAAAASMLEHLDERSRRILTLRFGLDGGATARTLKEVAGLVGCSEQEVRQQESAALLTIRRHLRGDSV